jgi:hypothetical protein
MRTTNYFKNVSSIEELKKRYKELALKYHPDREGGDTATMQEINNEYKYFCDHPTFEYKHEGDKADLNIYPDVINKIINLKGIVIELIGAWLWVSGETKQHRTILKESGFWFAPKKQMWYFRPENFKSKNHKPKDINAIRNKYGSDVIKQKEQNEKKELILK